MNVDVFLSSEKRSLDVPFWPCTCTIHAEDGQVHCAAKCSSTKHVQFEYDYSIFRSSDDALAVYETCTCMHILYTYNRYEFILSNQTDNTNGTAVLVRLALNFAI